MRLHYSCIEHTCIYYQPKIRGEGVFFRGYSILTSLILLVFRNIFLTLYINQRRSMEIRFETKADSQARREKEASERTPNERFLFFLRLMVEINKFQTKREKHSNNFILERKV